MTDGNVGLSASKTYQNAFDINGGGATVNGVVFGSGGTTSGTNWSLSGATTSFTTNTTPTTATPAGHNNLAGGLKTLVDNFTYNGNPAVLTLNGLTPGQTYVVTSYAAAFGAAGQRVMSSITADDGGSVANYDENAGGDGNGNLLRYTFIAPTGVSSLKLTFTPATAGNTFHFYGVSNEQVFNNNFTNGGGDGLFSNSANWSKNAVPGGAGSNAAFNASSPATITLDADTTIGHIQFDGASSITLSGTNTLTFTPDVGGVSVLNSLTGTHTISAPVTFSTGSNPIKFGAGTLLLTGTVTPNSNTFSVTAGRLGGTATNLAGLGVNLTTNNGLAFPAGGAFSVGSIAGTGNLALVDDSSNPVALTVGGNNANASYAGVLSGGGSLTKAGTGTQTLTSANTFTGATTVSAGTLAISNVNGLSASSGIKLDGGTLSLLSNTAVAFNLPAITTGTANNGTINVGNNGSGSNLTLATAAPITIPAGRTLSVTGANGYSLSATGGITLSGAATLAGTGQLIANSAVNYGANNLTVTTNLLALTTPATGTGSTTIGAAGSLAVSNMNQIASGNLTINGGVLVLEGQTISGGTIAGRTIGTGTGQIQLTTVGFAARGSTLTVSGLPANFLDTKTTILGSAAQVNGAYYANASVDITQALTITGATKIVAASNGPAITGGPGSGVSQRISGGISGVGFLNASRSALPVGGIGLPDLVLAGPSTWTGGTTAIGTALDNTYTVGPGGLLVEAGGNLASGIRFDDTALSGGQTSLPTGNGGQPALLVASESPHRTGFYFTSSAAGQTYTVPTGYRFLLGTTVNNNSASDRPAILGSTAGVAGPTNSGNSSWNATLSSAPVLIGSATTGENQSQDILVRDGTFTLGTGNSYATSVRFSRALINGQITAAGGGLADATGTGTIYKVGMGTAILGNVQYGALADTAYSVSVANRFTWVIGSANNIGIVQPANYPSNGVTSLVFDGAVRETAFRGVSDGTNTLKDEKVTLAGGVIEIGAAAPSGADFTASLGTAVGQVNMAGIVVSTVSQGGAGFSAYDAVPGSRRTIQLNNGTAGVTFGAGNFVASGQPLIFGSTSANGTAVLQNPVALGTAAQRIGVVKGLGTAPEGELAAAVTGTGGLTVSNMVRPDGAALPGGTVVFAANNTYSGSTTITGTGTTVFVNGTTSGQGSWTVSSGSALGGGVGATAGGIGLTAAATNLVTIQSGGALAPGNNGTGILNITNTTPGTGAASTLTLASGSTYRVEVGGITAGTGYDQVNVTGTVNVSGSTLQVSLLPAYAPSVGDKLFIITNDGTADAVTGTFSGLAQDATFTLGANTFQISYAGDAGLNSTVNGNDVVLSVTAVPEPATIGCLALAGIGLLTRRRRTAGR